MTPAFPARVPPDVLAAAEAIRVDAENGYSRFRGRGDLSTAGILTGIGGIYLKAQSAMASLQIKAGEDRVAQTARLTAVAFGIDDIAGTNPLDRASAAMSYRDALDRAGALDDPSDALLLLQRASDTGDELLARAIAQQAWSQGLGWDEPLNVYVATRPNVAQALADLRAMAGPVGAQDLFAFVLNRPAELAGLQDWQIPGVAVGSA